MSVEKYSCYKFQIRKVLIMGNKITLGFTYELFDPYYKPSEQTVIRESVEWFDTEQEARFAAIGHINLLESGEG